MSTVALHSSTSDSENDPVPSLYAFSGHRVAKHSANRGGLGGWRVNLAPSTPHPRGRGRSSKPAFRSGSVRTRPQNRPLDPCFSWEEIASAVGERDKALRGAHRRASASAWDCRPRSRLTESSTHSSSGDMPLTVAHLANRDGRRHNGHRHFSGGYILASERGCGGRTRARLNGTAAEVAFLSGKDHTNTVAATSFATCGTADRIPQRLPHERPRPQI